MFITGDDAHFCVLGVIRLLAVLDMTAHGVVFFVIRWQFCGHHDLVWNLGEKERCQGKKREMAMEKRLMIPL
jgi:hypothetical protein